MNSPALIFCILLGVVPSSISQGYFNKIVEFPDKSPNPIILELDNENYIVGSINIIENLSSSSIVCISRNDFSSNIIDYKGFKLGRNGLFVEEGDSYSFGDNFIDVSKLSLNVYSENWEVEESFDYEPLHGRRAALGSNLIDGYIYGPSIDEDDSLEIKEITLKKLALDGNEVWSKNFGKNDDYTFTYEVEPSADQNLLMTAVIEPPNFFGRKNKIYKISTDGNILWTYTTTEEPWIGTGCWISTLSNDEILISRSLDYAQNFDHLLNGYYPYPPEFIWLDNNGQFRKDTTLLSETQHELHLLGHTSSDEGFTIGYGVNEPAGGSLQKGWLFKMDNEGEIIWTKTYLHPQFPNRDHRITDIEILENGDIVCLGGISKGGEKSEIWLFRVNKYGCFGENNCEDDLIYTNTVDINLENDITIYPNPSTGIVNIDDISKLKNYILSDSNGKVLESNIVESNLIDFSSFPDGVYFLKLSSNKGVSHISKLILMR